MIIDFRHDLAPWQSIDDGVMGGVSTSRMRLEKGTAVFEGIVSLENNGGFASVRSAPASHDLSAWGGLVLRVQGDGQRYKLRLRTTDAFDGVNYEAAFIAPQQWTEVRIAFDALRPVYRGRPVADHPPFDPSRVVTFGLMISDGQEGPFRLEIEWINGSRA